MGPVDRRDRLVKAGQWLRTQREQRDIAARDVAQQLGVLPQTVYNWEAGKTGVDDDRAEQIAELFGMDVIDVRRNLGLWVPPDREGSAAEQLTEEELVERIRRDPAKRRRLLDAILAGSGHERRSTDTDGDEEPGHKAS